LSSIESLVCVGGTSTSILLYQTEMANTRRTWSIPYTPTPVFIPTAPRSFLPIQPCPINSHSPPLPSPPRQTIHAAYALTTHLIPAAFPRSVPDVPFREIPPHSTPDRQAQVASLARELIEERACFAQGKLYGDHSQKPLWNCVNRYVRTDNPGSGLTLLLAHANGFPKEACYQHISLLKY